MVNAEHGQQDVWETIVMAGTGQILFIQGGGAGTHDEWDNELVDSLRRELGDGYEVRYPRMPDEDDPSYATWSAAIRREIAALDGGAVVAGHSVGGTILINALAERPPERKLRAIVLIAAPFVGAGGCPATSSSCRTTSARGCRKACRYMCSMGSRTTLPHRRMPTCTRASSRRRSCIGCPDAITSWTTI
ncbi:alpha/beta fold hydrolase [Micromonospora sp. NPDC005206]|uniref:alpha/beta fold hydrolase n=1 Tax=Micromonospora sp. NPDC005206 TaxID=3157022 RepID=UPI0033BB6C7E